MGCLEIGIERKTRRRQFAGQSDCPVNAVVIRRIAKQQLVLGPVERMDMQDRRRLPGGLAVRKDLIERRAVSVPRFEIDLWRNRDDNRELASVPVGQLQGTLPSHFNTGEADAARFDAPLAEAIFGKLLSEEINRALRRIERLEQAICPPAFRSVGTNAGQAMPNQLAGIGRVVANRHAVVTVQEDDRAARWFGSFRSENVSRFP